VWNHHELGECLSSQESIVHSLKIGHLELHGFSLEVLSSPEGYRKKDLSDGHHYCTRDYAMERSLTGAQKRSKQPYLVKSLQKRRSRELLPSTSTRLSLMSFTMGQTTRGYIPGFGIKYVCSPRSKVMETSDHISYSGVVGLTTMTS
jgi:hypothetical protein